VQKLGRIILFALAGLLILAAVVLLGMNLYVQSQGTQARIQQELRQRLGTALRISRISVTPWGGLKLSGISIPQTTEPNSPTFLEAKSFTLQLRFLSLFSKKLVITQVALVDPNVTWPQNSQGRWRLPGTVEKEKTRAPEPEEVVTEIPAFSPSAEVVPSQTPMAVPSTGSENPAKENRGAFVPEVRRVSLRGGNFQFLDHAGKMVATFNDVGFQSVLRNAIALYGRANIGKISLRDRFFLEQLRSPVHYEPGTLEFSQITARAGDGDVAGNFSMQTLAEDSPFNVEVKFRNVQADRIVTEAGGPVGVLQGRLEGNFRASGKTADADALTGSGDVTLSDGQVKQYSLLVALGQVLQIEELTQLHLEQAEAKYHIDPGVITIDSLILHSANIHLSANGTITFAGKMHLDSKLAINEKIRSQLYKPLRANFQPADEPGYYSLDFQVTGSVERPKTNLLDKVVGRDLKDFFNILRGKSNRPKKKSNERTQDETPTPTVAPQPSSAPSP
jgi:type II secretion system protein N